MNIDEIGKIIPHCLSCGRHCPLDGLHCTKGQEFLFGFLYTMNVFEGGLRTTVNMKSNYSVLYFSGTGNSAFVARKAAAVTGGDLVSVNDLMKSGAKGDVPTGENIVICAPVYAWRIPRAAENWLRSVSFPDAVRVWFLLTCGSEIGGAPEYCRKLASDMNLEYMGTNGFVMPCNHLTMFDVPDETESEQIINDALPLIDASVSAIASGRTLDEPKLSLVDRARSGIVTNPFYTLFIKAKPFTATDKCVGCGKCELLCPLNNITMADGRPAWGDNCTHCLSCICRCPQEAIEYGRKSIGKRRYHLD